MRMRFDLTILIAVTTASGLCAQNAPVAPLVTKYCAACHGPKKAANDLDLTTLSLDVGKNLATWETIKQRLEAKEMPPKNKPQPTDAERKQVVAWIDGEIARAARAVPVTPGRVTLRRLNRVEYNRTIQDLTGVNFRPADDFPTDDVGHGFDNIGDVLSLPPLLLEKYLNASEKIVARLLDGEVVPPVVRKIGARDLKATTENSEIVPIRAESMRTLGDAGAIYTEVTVPRAGELIYRVKLVARQNGSDKVRVAFRVDGKEIRTQVIGVKDNNPVTMEARAKVAPGSHRLAIALLNPNDESTPKKERRGIGVSFFEYEEPTEPPQRSAAYSEIFMGSIGVETRDRARQILTGFSRRAWRRPPTNSEVSRLVQLFDQGRTDGLSFERSIGLALQAALVSPHFLFRVERDRAPDRADGSYALNDWEIASRLSYFLWSTMPDAELFSLAEKGKLRDPAVRAQQVQRMLKDPKIAGLVENFGGQWLNLRNLQTAQPARRDFPAWDELLRSAMKTETEMFFRAILQEDRNILEFLDADFTFVNERLARHYGIEGVSGPEFRRVTLTNRNRGGVLTQASVLTITSNPTRTSPVKRGKWILENILGTPPPPPPPNVPELKEDRETALKGSLRERMEQHRANPNCATCHTKMDALGFGFENFDAVGGWRTKDGAFAIDPSGALPTGEKFSGPAELKRILKGMEPQFRRCLTEKMLTYALGRGVEASDRPAVERISAAAASDRNRFQRLVLEIVQSDAFLRRTVKR